MLNRRAGETGKAPCCEPRLQASPFSCCPRERCRAIGGEPRYHGRSCKWPEEGRHLEGEQGLAQWTSLDATAPSRFDGAAVSPLSMTACSARAAPRFFRI